MADLNSTNRIIDKALTQLSKSINKVEPRFAKLIIEWVNKFNTSSGNIIRSKSNTQRLSGFQKAIERFAIRSGY